MIYKVWIHVEQVDEYRDSCQDIGVPYEAGVFNNRQEALAFVKKISAPARTPQLRRICEAGLMFLGSLPQTELTTDLQNRQVFRNMLEDCLKNVNGDIDNSCSKCKTSCKVLTIREQCPEALPTEIKVNILSEGGQIWIQPRGYGEKCAADCQGRPIGIEIWQGRLRLIIFADINSQNPQVIDLERARESARIRCNWCRKELETDSIKWNGLLFCSEACLDACRAAQ